MPRLRPPSSARRTWCPARSRQLAMPGAAARPVQQPALQFQAAEAG
uniref:Uncharacterized protein n=1 Tax=Macrostomum lignano TaxID=282301 RepID=A0A1I8F548_9PLAT